MAISQLPGILVTSHTIGRNLVEKSYNLNDAASRASGVNVTAKTKKQKTVKTFVVFVCIAITAIFVGFTLTAFLTKTDFNKDVPLDEDISRWTPLNWVTSEGHINPDTVLTSDVGEWTASKEASSFTNKETGCTLLLSSVTGDTGVGGGDRKNTDTYRTNIGNTVGTLENVKDVWVQVDGGARVEMTQANYKNGLDKFGQVIYRHSPANAKIMLAVFSCDSEEQLAEVTEGDALGNLGVMVKPDFFNVF